MSKKSLSLKNVKLLYQDKAIDGLHDISFDIKQGEVFGLMGPSGCGKSTLAKVISHKLQFQNGDYQTSFENPLYLEENILNHELSVLENFIQIAHGDTQNQKITRARMACSDLEITNYINTPVKNLSMGQRQRVLLGMALVSQSDLIILDEPFSHLEAPLKRELIEVLFPLFQEMESTIIWISHDQHILFEFADRIALMNYGKIIQLDEPETLYFHPNSLFSADFFGECNKEFLIDGKSQFWDVEFDIPEGLKNPMLVYRPHAVEIINKNEESKFTMVSSIFYVGNYLYKFNSSNNVCLSFSQKKLSHNNYDLKLNRQLTNIIE